MKLEIVISEADYEWIKEHTVLTDYRMTEKIYESVRNGTPLKNKKIGKWIGISYDSYADGNPVYDVFECSLCGCEHKGESDTLTDYCPDCGAKMAKEDEG